MSSVNFSCQEKVYLSELFVNNVDVYADIYEDAYADSGSTLRELSTVLAGGADRVDM